MQAGRKHLFHIVDPSPWPFITALGGFFLTSGLAFYMHRITYGGYILVLGFFILLMCAFFWFSDIIRESTFLGFHALVVRKGLVNGFLLFITSEVMLFFGFFWAFFHSSLCPSTEFGLIWPPHLLSLIPIFDYPLFNTFLLIISGFAVTWLHCGIAMGSMKDSIDGFFLTIILGLFFIILQGMEYYEASFNITDSVYGSVFYMLTGLHGCHVIIGVVFLFVCFLRLLNNHFLRNHYLGLVCAIWYWHFVDGVWILLYLALYCWGSW